jgi:acetate kinase
MKVLVINSGSSSIKYLLFDTQDKIVLATGLLEQIGETQSCLTHRSCNRQGEPEAEFNARSSDLCSLSSVLFCLPSAIQLLKAIDKFLC